MSKLRVIDTGVHGGRFNIAVDHALIENHRAGHSPDTLRFLEFQPSALVGRHQDVSREIDRDYWQQHGIEVGRRMTGGGAIYLDTNQLGWELICHRRNLPANNLNDVAATICNAAVAGRTRLGIPAQYRPRNDIEVFGQKISGTGGFFDGDTLFYQGTLILNLDADTMFQALRVSPDKQHRHDIKLAAQRVTAVAQAATGAPPQLAEIKTALTSGFAEQLKYNPESGRLSAQEQNDAQTVFNDEIGTHDFVFDIDQLDDRRGWAYADIGTAGGQLRAACRLSRHAAPYVEQVFLSGDYFVTPPRVIFDLESGLKNSPVEQIKQRVEKFFTESEIDLMSFTANDVIAVVESSIATAPASAQPGLSSHA